MAEDKNEQEPTAEEKAKFEQDVLKAAEDAMKLDERRETRDESDSEKIPPRILLKKQPQTSPLTRLPNLQNLPRTCSRPNLLPPTTATCA
jgi:hypothetical protein